MSITLAITSYTLLKGGGENQGLDTEPSTTAASGPGPYASSSNNSSTFIIKGRKRALSEAYNRSLNVNQSYYCITGDELVKSYKPFMPLLQDQVFRRGGSSYIITNIEKQTISAVRDLTEAGAEIRHIDISALRRSVIYDDKVAYFSIIEPVITRSATENVEQTEGEDLWVGSTEPSVVQSATKHFLSDWKKAIPSRQRINELEKGIEPEFLKVITDNEEAADILLDIAESVKIEALIIMPNAQGMLRMEKLGVIDRLIEASQKGATVKIICPLADLNSHIVKRIFEQAPDVKVTNGYEDAPSGILIADCEKFLQAEIRNPEADEFSKAVGFAIYSNSKRNVISFKSFFELLWNERIVNEELKRTETMQREFINIAAHELKTPIQPILGLTEVLRSQIKDVRQKELLEVAIRNAKRLQRLTNDILDVTRIEGKSLELNKEDFNLNDIVINAINDITLGRDFPKDANIKLTYNQQDILIQADKGRILQVISNLLSNGIKFTTEGTILVSTEKDKNNNSVNVSVKDSGQGIDSSMLARLFTKFASKSHKGTGLGLFISKGIIEAHGGKIWGENNPDGRGATFSFSLPTR
jgi:nitrogen-specific signal transduction histidine kinase